MSIVRHNNLNQVCCDSCPASYPNTYADEDWSVMIADAKTAGWQIRKAGPRRYDDDTTDLFSNGPRVAGKQNEPYTHTCPDCLKPIPSNTLL